VSLILADGWSRSPGIKLAKGTLRSCLLSSYKVMYNQSVSKKARHFVETWGIRVA